ncbi:MAG: thioredoxin domain-containing protein [Litorimonas sp.]
MTHLIRTSLLLATTALLAACGANAESPASTSTATVASADRSAFERPDDHAIGNPDAAVTVVEYASVSCGACANWHNTVYPDFKKKYVDTGKVRYVFREFRAGEPTMADAGFMIALCAPEEKYFENIGLQFKRQAQMFEFARNGQLREAYINLAKSSGLSEDEFTACMANSELRAEYQDREQSGLDLGVTGTPAFVINGELQRVFTLESMEEVILPLLGEEVPTATEATDEEPSE